MYSLRGAVLWVVVAAAVVMQCDAAVSCLDENGKPVDWFIVVKLPTISASSKPQIRAGYGYMYMDNHQTNLALSNVGLNANNHAIAYTLQQIYNNRGSQNVGYLMYNDQLPDSNRTSSKFGHTKGDLAFDAYSGFWLVHSTPRFPSSSSSSYNWPSNARKNGQSFLCVTFGLDQFEDIGEQLLYNNPWIYDSNLPSKLVVKIPSIVRAVKGQHVTLPPWQRSVSLTSTGGQSFTSFAKYTKFNEDLYSFWLAPYFKNDLFVETWQNGHNKMQSFCGGTYNVNNIVSLKFDGVDGYKRTKDHSKWAVTAPKGSQWICIGDINRMLSQKLRSGGTVCFMNDSAHKNFLNAITDFEKCPP